MLAGRIAAAHNEASYDIDTIGRAVTFGVALTKGALNLVAVSCYTAAGGTTLGVVGSVNGAYTQVGTYQAVPTADSIVSLWMKENQQATSAEVVTVTPNQGAYLTLSVESVLGIVLASSLRDVQKGNTSSATAHATPSVAVGVGDFVFALVDTTNQDVSTVDSPFTLSSAIAHGATVEGLATAWHFPASASEAATFRVPVASQGANIIASFRRRTSLLGSLGVGD